MWKNVERRPFFRADMAGLGKYCMCGYGRIGVYRVKIYTKHLDLQLKLCNKYRHWYSQEGLIIFKSLWYSEYQMA